MRVFWALLGGFAALVLLGGGLLLWQGSLAHAYGEQVARALPSPARGGACADLAPEVRPAPALRMLRDCRIETSGGATRLRLTMTDGRTYQADVTTR